MIANPEAVAKTLSLKSVGSQWQGACPVCGGHDRFWITKQGKYGCRQCSYNRELTKVLKSAGAELPDSSAYRSNISQQPVVAERQPKALAYSPREAFRGSLGHAAYEKRINTTSAVHQSRASFSEPEDTSAPVSLKLEPTPIERKVELPSATLTPTGTRSNPENSTYVKFKGMRSEDCYIARVPEFNMKQSLIIPVRTHDGVIIGYQAISDQKDANGKFQRRYNKGCDRSGVAVSMSSQMIGELSGQTAYLVEGWATGLALVNSGFHAVWMLDSNHLCQNAMRLANTYPDVEFIVAADNDQVGLYAAKESGLVWCVPPKEGQDFWDLYAVEGALAVRNVLDPCGSPQEAKFASPSPVVSTISEAEGKPLSQAPQTNVSIAIQESSWSTSCPLLAQVIGSADVEYHSGVLRINPHARQGVSHHVDCFKVESWLQRKNSQLKNVEILQREVLSLLHIPVYRYIGYKTGVFNNGRAKGVKLSFVDAKSGESVPLFFNADLLYARGAKKGERRPDGEFTPKEHSKFMSFWRRTLLPEARYASEYKREMSKLKSLIFVAEDPSSALNKDNIQPLNLSSEELKTLLNMR